MTLSFSFSPSVVLCAENYPPYLNPEQSYIGRTEKIKSEGYTQEVLSQRDMLNKTRVERLNQSLQIANNSYQAAPASTNEIAENTEQIRETAHGTTTKVALQRQQREQFASINSELNFVPHSDGKIVYFKDGLVSRIENERVVDEYGNVRLRDSYNYQYDDNRLLIGFEADIKDTLGNITHIFCYGITYSPDSLFYGGYDTNANKNETEKYIKEIDSAGNIKLTHWKALSYDGKLLRAFSQEIEDSIYGKTTFTRSNINYENDNYRRVSSYHEEGVRASGLDYELDQTNITYNDKHMVTGYHEEIISTNIDGSLTETIVDAQFKYLDVPHQFGPDVEERDPDRLLESIITTSTLNPDGSKRTETVTVTYDYDANQQLVGASGNSIFTGQEADWWELTDEAGHILSKDIDENGNVIYVYVDPDTHEIITVPEGEVTATLKEGNKYNGSSEIQYEILYGMPMTSTVESEVSYYDTDHLELLRTEESSLTYNNGLVNNLRRVLDTQEHTKVTYPSTDAEGNPQIEIRDIATDYIYTEYGNLIAAVGKGTGSGYEFTENGWKKFQSKFYIEYDVILGEARQTRIEETRQYED